jgi:hypothetical protein
MNLTGTIESAELQFKQILEEFFISVYDEKYLSSHGIDHHRRVWSYSKELLTRLAGQNPTFIYELPSKLIIASYLHDIGMSVETGIIHGKHGKDLCIRFLDQNHFPLNDYQDVLSAIENHDIKDYTGNNIVNDLLTILSVADDLDAFGFTGIFRYSEIYLKRGINPEEIGHLIMENAGMRFDNFVKTFGFTDELVQKHKKRYDILDNFFKEYNNQVTSYQFVGQHPSGYCGVVEMLLYMINNKKAVKEFYQEPEKYSYDPVILWFFDGLASEFSAP